MNWQDILRRYRKTELMVGFTNFVNVNDKYHEEVDEYYLDDDNIKDLWGYLIVFAEMKGIIISIDTSDGSTKCLCSWVGEDEWTTISNDRDSELGMIWCANKMFELWARLEKY